MKRILLGLLAASAFLLSSCTTPSVVLINDGELDWETIPYARISSGKNSDGDITLWAPHFMTEIGNSLRGVTFMITTCEPGTCYGEYDASSETWSTPAIQFITMNLDYDGIAYPTWRGQSATLIIHSYNKRTKRINATLYAEMRKDDSSDTRNIQVEMENMTVEGK